MKRKNLNSKIVIHSEMSNITQKWVNLLIPFTDGYKSRLFESELARLASIPQQTASRYLKELVAQHIINYEEKGRNKLFYFDFSKHTTKIVLEMLENSKALYFQQKAAEISLIISEILNHAESVIVFGSYASYKSDESSDLDVVITGKYNKSEIRKIKQNQVMQINEHYASYAELSKLEKSKNPLAIEIIKNHIIFGNVSNIVRIFLEAQ